MYSKRLIWSQMMFLACEAIGKKHYETYSLPKEPQSEEDKNFMLAKAEQKRQRKALLKQSRNKGV
jgi:hypothetical protein